jgi:poly(A) polymerase
MALTDSPRILARADHPVSRRNIDINAIKVLYRLRHAGFKSYLVGGAVRDLMLRRRPKDFDVGSDARPQQVRRLFRNSRIIGRRFRLVHIYFREGIIEVSTFRGRPDPEEQAASPGDILITDDNVFGSPCEDAARRDFTVNALFYDVSDFSIIDYVGGVDDLEKGLIRTIGDPDVRFQEDPVRMLRACELAGRLDFQIDAATRDAVVRQRREIAKASAPRIAEEVGQILRSGSAAAILGWASELGLLEEFFPEAEELVSIAKRDDSGFERVPEALDQLISEGRKLSDATCLAAMVLPMLLLKRRQIETRKGGPMKRGAGRQLAAEFVSPFAARLALSRQKADTTVEAISIFHRLGEAWKSGAEQVRFSTRVGFDDAVDLLELLVRTTGDGRTELDRWRAVQKKRPKPPQTASNRRRRRRRRRRR